MVVALGIPYRSKKNLAGHIGHFIKDQFRACVQAVGSFICPMTERGSGYHVIKVFGSDLILNELFFSKQINKVCPMVRLPDYIISI